MSEHDDLEPAEVPPALGPGAKSILRVAGAAVIVLLLVMVGVAIGANLWPHVARVEQRVVEPVRLAAASRRGLDALPNTVDQSCPAIALLRRVGAATPPPAQPMQGKHAPLAKAPALSPPNRAVGFFVGTDGYLLTVAAAFEDGPVEAVLSDGRVLSAANAGVDPLSGLALFKVEGRGFATLPFAEDGYPRIGQTSLALAPAFARGCTARMELVSDDFINQSESLRSYVSLQEGLDGSWLGAPLLDLDGRVIGLIGPDILTDPSHGIVQVLPGSTVGHVADQLVRDGTSTENRFGFEVEDLSPALAGRLGASAGGAVVSLIEPGSDAQKAGLKAGDIVRGANGQPVSSGSELARALDSQEAVFSLQVQRQGEPQVVTLGTGS